MNQNRRKIDAILVNGLTYILKRSIKVNPRDQLAIAQEYKEWINCITASDFSKEKILVLDNYTFN